MFRGGDAVVRVVVVVATLFAGLVVAAGLGSAVPLSADGMRLAVGAPRANGPVSMPGVVLVFDEPIRPAYTG